MATALLSCLMGTVTRPTPQLSFSADWKMHLDAPLFFGEEMYRQYSNKFFAVDNEKQIVVMMYHKTQQHQKYKN